MRPKNRHIIAHKAEHELEAPWEIQRGFEGLRRARPHLEVPLEEVLHSQIYQDVASFGQINEGEDIQQRRAVLFAQTGVLA